MFDDICSILNISLIEFLNGKDIEDNEKDKFIKKELENTFKKQTIINKVIDISSLLLIGIGFVLLIFISIVSGPYLLFYREYIICYFISLFGFICLMYKSKKSAIKKILYSIIFSIIFYIINLILVFIGFITLKPNAHYVNSNDNYFLSCTLYKNKNNFSIDNIDYYIESGIDIKDLVIDYVLDLLSKNNTQ